VKLPVSWLADHVDLELSLERLADELNLTGTAVEGVEYRGVPPRQGNADAFVVGRVESAEQHPNADRLRVCMVDTGDAEPAQIVCGAPNVAAGQLVAVALPGAVMPGGLKLKKAKLRGVESRGMICSEQELELGAESDGIMVLEVPASPGDRLVDVLPAAADAVLELELTSNRPDCQSVAGMGREVGAILDRSYRPVDLTEPPAEGAGSVEDYVALRVDAPDLCPRYMARVFLDVEVGPSPAWLRHRIEAAGMRPISNVVDITNYVMLLTGQPLHAFDLDTMAGPEIVVRRAGEGEQVVTLDDVERALDATMLAICDAERPAVIAGIMGAADVEVTGGTTRVLLEAANFDGPTILHTELKLGLRTESSGRFEKGLPPALPPVGMTVASRMLVELCGASMVPGTLDACEPIPEPRPIVLRHDRVDLLLGDRVDPAESAAILRRLECEVEEGEEHHTVRPPFFRQSDLTREADLVEEVGRVRRYQRITPRMPRTVGQGRRTPEQELIERLGRRAADLGLSQAITYAMVPEGDADRLRMAADDRRRDVVRLAHPLSEEMGVLRRSMLPGLLRAAAHNQAHQRPHGGLFEFGRTYAPAAEGLADEGRWLAALLFGQPDADHWRVAPRPADFFAAKGLIETLAQSAEVHLQAHANEAPYFHPARQARMQSGDRVVGWVGEIHPLVLEEFGVRGGAAALVLDLTALLEAAPGEPVAFEDLVTVPVSTRDLAVVLDEEIPSARLPEVALAAADLVRDARVFDRYIGDQVDAGKVSLALRLSIADPGRTLTDEEIDAQVQAVAAALEGALGATLRG
jgi:phenylalanyl-tRNA synthetase beta chain